MIARFFPMNLDKKKSQWVSNQCPTLTLSQTQAKPQPTRLGNMYHTGLTPVYMYLVFDIVIIISDC